MHPLAGDGKLREDGVGRDIRVWFALYLRDEAEIAQFRCRLIDI